MYLYIMGTRISYAIGKEVRHGQMQLNGKVRKCITNKAIRNGKLGIKLVAK